MRFKKTIAAMFVSALALPLVLTGCGGAPNDGGGDTDTVKDGSWVVASADSSIKVNVEFVGSELTYSVSKDGKDVVLKSNTGINSDILEQFDKLPTPTVATDSKDISYSPITGKKSHVNTHYNELTLTFAQDVFRYEVIFRAYNDGYAFRYKQYTTDGSADQVIFSDEQTTFALPETSKLYVMSPNLAIDAWQNISYDDVYKARFCYEESYTQTNTDKMNGLVVSMPMLYQTPDKIWSLITESELIGSEYRGSYLEGDDDCTFRFSPAYTQTLMGAAQAPFVSPWRLGIVGGLDTVVESTLAEDVYDEVEYWKPDNYDSLSAEEKETYNYDWVVPNKCGWTWLQLGSGTQKQWAQNRLYIKNAHDQGYDWFLIDAGWIPTDSELTQFNNMMKYAKDLGVHMMCWASSYGDFGDRKSIETTISKWKDYGFEGIKIDFWDGLYADKGRYSSFGESQSTLAHYEEIYQIAAKYRMMLNIHGCNKPTGERRKYPHVIAREGIRGNENKQSVKASDCVTIPYIRASIGPSDYTPSLEPFGKSTTVASQMALHIMYETGILTMSDRPDVYEKYADEAAFLAGLPVVYDDIKYMSGAPMVSSVIARRKGNDWYIGGMSIANGEMTVDLGKILDANKTYTVVIFSDGEDWLATEKEVKEVKGNEVLTVANLANGGFALSVKEKI